MRRRGRWSTIQRYWIVYLMALPVIAYYIIFHYLSMFGIGISFQNYRVTRGFFGGKWVGLENFIDFLILNTRGEIPETR